MPKAAAAASSLWGPLVRRRRRRRRRRAFFGTGERGILLGGGRMPLSPWLRFPEEERQQKKKPVAKCQPRRRRRRKGRGGESVFGGFSSCLQREKERRAFYKLFYSTLEEKERDTCRLRLLRGEKEEEDDDDALMCLKLTLGCSVSPFPVSSSLYLRPDGRGRGGGEGNPVINSGMRVKRGKGDGGRGGLRRWLVLQFFPFLCVFGEWEQEKDILRRFAREGEGRSKIAWGGRRFRLCAKISAILVGSTKRHGI